MKDIIVKAEEGGFDLVKFAFLNCKTPLMSRDELVKQLGIITFFDHIIFSPDFLKAYFPDTDRYDIGIICVGKHPDGCSERIGKVWQYHAQQLVLAEDRLEYLRRFL